MNDDARPWLALYGDIPPTLRSAHATGVDLARAALDAAGDDPVLWYFDTPISASTVDADADALAVALAGKGVGHGDRVLFQLQNMPQFVIVLLAVWRLGAIAVPVNVMYRTRELTTMLADCRPAAMITLNELWAPMRDAAAAAGVDGPIFAASDREYLDQPLPPPLARAGAAPPAEAPDLRAALEEHRGRSPAATTVTGDDVAALIYTSGTTGPPKGAMILHRNFVFAATVFASWMGVDDTDVIMGLAPPFHVTGLVANFGVAFVARAPLVLAHRFDAGESLRLVERHRATFTVAAITAFSALMNDPRFDEADLSSLRTPCTGGAPVAAAIVERWRARTGAYIRNTYGMTESTAPTLLTPRHLESPVDPASGALSAGIPVCDTMVEIVDETGRMAADGEVGEFVTSGPQVVAGYWGRPAESEQTFPGGRLHTGDIGFRTAEGWFFLLDRSKDLIVASGYKVWPTEVEDVLCEHPAVREAAVVGVPDEYRGETVKAVVSLVPGARAEVRELIAFCKERMAAYKYPRVVEIVEELPKNAAGKILRRELRAEQAQGS